MNILGFQDFLEVIISKDSYGETRSTFLPIPYVARTILIPILLNRFVGSLLYLPPTSTFSTPILFSAGGDPSIQTFDLSAGTLLSSYPIEELLLPHVMVAPSAPEKVLGRKDRKELEAKGKGKGKEKAKGKVVESEMEVDSEVLEGEEEEEEVEGEGEGEESVREVLTEGPHAWKDGVTTAMAVYKLALIGDRDSPSAGLIVATSGFIFSLISSPE